MSRPNNDYLLSSLLVYRQAILDADGLDEVDAAVVKLATNQIKIIEELLEYRKTGLTPEQIIEMDKLYSEMAKELGKYKKLAGDDLK